MSQPGTDAFRRDSAATTYPGGKSGPGIYQRLINLIPQHRVLVSAFAGRCGVVRNIKPAEHTIVIDADESVCEWWDSWRRSKQGRALEIHHCDSIAWIRHRFGLTKYFAADSGVTREPLEMASVSVAAELAGGRPAETFLFADPPYVLSERAHGKQYACELTDDDHRRLLRILTMIPAALAAVMICGYSSALYATLDPWRSIDHRVPTRGGLQDETIWMNFPRAIELHDYRYIGDCRRSRERIRRRQKNWLSQLNAMSDRERAAMLDRLNSAHG